MNLQTPQGPCQLKGQGNLGLDPWELFITQVLTWDDNVYE